jgi:hypothetical protein
VALENISRWQEYYTYNNSLGLQARSDVLITRFPPRSVTQGFKNCTPGKIAILFPYPLQSFYNNKEIVLCLISTMVVVKQDGVDVNLKQNCNKEINS